MRLSPTAIVLPGFFVLLTLSGCRCGGANVDVSCSTSADCVGSESCVNGFCTTGGGAGGGNGSNDGGDQDGGSCVLQCGAGCCGAGYACKSDVCVLTCATGETKCGDPGSEVCCNSSEVCYLGACVTPGANCTGNSDCQSTEYCDPSVNKCLPRGTGQQCEYQPGDAGFQPTTLWNSIVTADAFTEVMMTPVVIDVNGDGTPDVLANYFSTSAGYGGPGVMRALNGATGVPLWTSQNLVAADNIHPPASIAAGILHTGGPMVAVTVAASGQLIAFDAATGASLWKSHDASGNAVLCNADWGGPALADLNGDGSAEIVCGFQAFDETGKQLWSAGSAAGSVGPLTVVADLDNDGQPDISDGVKAVHGDGSAIAWTGAGFGGLLAVGDFVDGTNQPVRDGKPELVVVNGGSIALVNGQTGDRIIAPSALPSWDGTQCRVGGGSTGNGGPPTVADFDGDGSPEVGVANLSCYSVFEVDMSSGSPAWKVIWSRKVQDQSSSVTGSSVFDFDGDGKAEVVYADEVLLHVFDGRTGATVFEQPHCSGTTYEYPVIVDVNGNGRADIVISENTYAAGGLGCAAGATSGIHAFKDGADNWVNTRSVWNQHTYHVTNVCDGIDQVCGGPGSPSNVYGRIPAAEFSNWSFNNKPQGNAAPPLNNYRQNVQGEGLFNAPDLAAKDLSEITSNCPSEMGLQVRVLNQGALGVLAGVKVAFYVDGSPQTLIGVTQTTGKLLPGQSEIVSIQWAVPSGTAFPVKIIARVDDDGTGKGSSSECHEDNNQIGPIDAFCGAIN